MYTYFKLIKDSEKKALDNNMEIGAIKWMFLYSDFKINYYQLKEKADEKIVEKFNKMVDDYVYKKIPPQYILNKAGFFNYDFYVDENVFIPRPETEQLVEETIYRIDNIFSNKEINICDLCCGSGAIGITLKKEIENCHVCLCDISEKALQIVEKNAKNLNADVEILQGDFIKPLLDKNKKYEVLVCNPPYIKNQEKLDEIVVNHEPNIALFGGQDGLDFYKVLFANYDKLVTLDGFMALEFGYDQKEALTKLIKDILPNKRYEFLKDFACLDRMLFIYSDK